MSIKCMMHDLKDFYMGTLWSTKAMHTCTFHWTCPCKDHATLQSIQINPQLPCLCWDFTGHVWLTPGGFLANIWLDHCTITLGLWKHHTCSIKFALVVDFTVKYNNCQDSCKPSKHIISTVHTGMSHNTVGITLIWDYIKCTVNLTMPTLHWMYLAPI